MNHDVAQNVAGYLAARNLTTDEILRCVDAKEGLVVLAGSIAEGYGNDDSDIDLICVTDESTPSGLSIREEGCHIYTRYAPNNSEVSIEQYGNETIHRLVKVMDEVATVIRGGSATISTIPTITASPDLRFLHRMRFCLPLRAPEQLEYLRERLHCDLFPAFQLMMHLKQHFAAREDALAELDSGHVSSAAWLLRNSTSALAAAALASLGYSQPTDRWRIRLLEDNSARVPQCKFLSQHMIDWATPNRETVEAWLKECDQIFMAIMSQNPLLLPIFQSAVESFPVRMTLGKVL
jgi:hypothetical protein